MRGRPVSRHHMRSAKQGAVRICADGGANRLYDCVEPDQRPEFLPHMIKGDLDSLRADVRAYYASMGVRIVHNGSEYATDLMKCIDEVKALEASLQRTVGRSSFGLTAVTIAAHRRSEWPNRPDCSYDVSDTENAG